MADDLVAFLRARLDEDEGAARMAAAPAWFLGSTEHDDKRSVRYTGPSTLHPGQEWDYFIADHVDLADANHMARHDPARVLREVAAKRAILARHRPWWDDYVDGDGIERATRECRECRPPGTPDNWPCYTIKVLAAVFSDHPGYRDEWKP
jgi:hypothetical protein